MARDARCTECPLFKKAVQDGQGRGPVMGEITPNSKLIVIGEAPGNREVAHGKPFVGATGRILNSKMYDGGIDRKRPGDVSLTNVLLCQPPTDFESYEDKLRAKAKAAGREAVLPTDCCRPRLETDLAEANATVEYAVGRQALSALARHYNVPYGRESRKRQRSDISIAALRKQHGAPIIVREPDHPDGAKVLIASYHPAFAMRGAKAWMPVIKTVIERAARIADRGGGILWDKPSYILDPTLDQIEAFVEEAVATKRLVMVDIETGPSRPGADDGGSIQTCALRAVGWGFRRDAEHPAVLAGGDREVIMVVPYRDMDGSLVWHADQYERLDAAICYVMDAAHLAGQNFSFDSAVLLRLGLMSKRKKRWCDLMLGHHNTDSNDLPHDLGFIISEHFEAPHHKQDIDHSSVDNVDYAMLKEYCADDVLTQLRCLDAVLERISDLGTVEQFKTDTKLAPIVRDMGDLGLVIDEHERQRLAKVLGERLDHFRAKFRFEVALLFASDAELKRVEDKLQRMRRDPHDAEFWTRAYQEYASRYGYGEFNPNSVYQLRDLFFDKLNLTPILNTDGYEFDAEADDDPSTSQAAVLKMMEKYRHIQPVCDALLEFRAYNKLYGTYVADKKGRIKDVDWTRWGLPPNIAKRILHTVYKIHVIPSGRLSTQPAIQNWPAVGKASMRTMVVSPDGHCIVGADYDQLELRIYAVVAQDKLLLQAFEEGLDPHSLNAAALLVEDERYIMDKYREIVDMPPKEKKYWRTVAKRFCVPSSTRVLTSRGEVEIIHVRDDDLLWDGVEWVSHEGVVFNGYQEVITWDGLTATPDHKVWRVDGSTSTLEQAALDGIRLARGSAGGQPLRFMDNNGAARRNSRRTNRTEAYLHPYAVRLRNASADGCDFVKGGEIGAVHSLRGVWTARTERVLQRGRSDYRSANSCWDSARPPHDDGAASVGRSMACSCSLRLWSRGSDRCGLGRHGASTQLCEVREAQGYAARPAYAPQWGAAALSGSELSSVQELRRSRHRVSVRVGRSSRALDRRQPRVAGELPRARHRSYRQRRSLRARQSALGNTQRQSAQQARGVHRATRTLVPVYDILNAGPRRRFTAENVIISNCYLETYGGEEEKLYATMAASRNKATGKRDFPKLQPKDVELWHKRWHRLHPETKRWQDNCKYIAYNHGHVRVGTLDHRARFWPGGIDKKNAPPNHTIQGFAASVANKALIELDEAIPYREWSPVSGLMLQVHDYIGAYVPRERAWEAKGIFEECMTHSFRGMNFTCTAEASYRWSEQG